MSSNIFSKTPNKNDFLQFLNNIAISRTDSYFYITPDSYKKANMDNVLNNYIQTIIPFYSKSKLYFINRPFNYKRLCTVIRQLSNIFSFTYTSDIKYIHSTYIISYKIYTTTEGT